jgi:hypothetical protein
MNERILELAEEHGFIHEHMSIGERNDALTKYQEFAELIVKECASKVTRNEALNILEHFGVK